jgi:L-rhamnose mutarotase
MLNVCRNVKVVAVCSAVLIYALLFMAHAAPKRAAQTRAAQRQLPVRKAFVMSVNQGQEAEYERRHRPIWPELETALKKHGVVTYSIFLLPQTRQLFAYVEFKNQQQWDAVVQTTICKKWWDYMKDVMPSNPDNSPISSELREVFHLETPAPSE